jgi:uncharacterized protein YjiS (DUF1127 family)
MDFIADSIGRVVAQRRELASIGHPLIAWHSMSRAARALKESDRPY